MWSDNEDFDPLKTNNSLQEPGDTYIIADSLKWRIINKYKLINNATVCKNTFFKNCILFRLF